MLSKTVQVILNIPTITKVIALILSFFTPIRMIVHALVIFLVIDAVTSIYWQFKENQKNNPQKGFKCNMLLLFATIESRKLRRTIEKMLFYVIALMMFYMFDRYFLKIMPTVENYLTTFSVTNLAAIMIGMVEITSIASNISKITNNPIFNKIIQITQKKVSDTYECK